MDMSANYILEYRELLSCVENTRAMPSVSRYSSIRGLG